MLKMKSLLSAHLLVAAFFLSQRTASAQNDLERTPPHFDVNNATSTSTPSNTTTVTSIITPINSSIPAAALESTTTQTTLANNATMTSTPAIPLNLTSISQPIPEVTTATPTNSTTPTTAFGLANSTEQERTTANSSTQSTPVSNTEFSTVVITEWEEQDNYTDYYDDYNVTGFFETSTSSAYKVTISTVYGILCTTATTVFALASLQHSQL